MDCREDEAVHMVMVGLKDDPDRGTMWKVWTQCTSGRLACLLSRS